MKTWQGMSPMVKRSKKAWQIAAISLSFIFFIVLLYIDHKKGHADYIGELHQLNTEIRQSFDSQIQSLVDKLPTLTNTIAPLNQCSKKTLEALGNYAFANPQLSTIAVKSKSLSSWCISPEFRTLIQPKLRGNTTKLIGPVTHTKTKETFFILQYPGNDDITYQLYILKSVLLNAINLPSPLINSTALITKDERILLETNPSVNDANQHASLESSEPSKLLPNILIHLDADEAYIQSGNSKKLWSLRLLSIAVAGLFLLALLLHINRSFSLESIIKQALRNEEFYPVFQPVIDANTRQIMGAELLIRWQDKHGEHIMPNQFIEEAEHSGQIVPLTIQLIESAFQMLGNYLQENRSFHLGINLCHAHFADETWLQTLIALCQQHDIEPSQIMLEVTERTIMDSGELNLSQHMKAMKDKGFQLAIDDFGTSHASISYLRHFPLDYLKIDMMYVHAIGTGAVTEALLPPIILIANQLNLKIIAEGVETEEQFNYLKERQVDYIQGWYFSKALGADDLVKRIVHSESALPSD
ncbi:EAL domain-containing protein [Legionella sp. W05-934-2]|jgi:EAL domain-containing protein (putative c-di-GMP-specific phosphodiesterase class I)|uniref:EAL domain-containing protein n=1 Tax=Legionella sp. W05-934-2 TaxID=1198649 RepID=UPI0034638343